MTRAKRGFAQVTQQRSGRYAVRYCLPNGQRVSAGKTFVRKADAEAWAADRRREIARGKRKGPEKITFTAYATTWLAGRSSRAPAPTTKPCSTTTCCLRLATANLALSRPSM